MIPYTFQEMYSLYSVYSVHDIFTYPLDSSSNFCSWLPLIYRTNPMNPPNKNPKPQDAAEALALKEAQQEAERAATARAQQAAEVRGEGF